MRFLEQSRQDARKSILLIEEPRPTNANCRISPSPERFRKRRLIKRKGRFARGGAARELRGEQTRMRAKPQRRWQESSKESMMRRVGKTRRTMPFFPSALTDIRRQRP